MCIPGQQHILRLWCENWQSHGFEPVILTQHHAESHPNFLALDSHIRVMPLMNNSDYEMACFHRWLAMANVGGGLMADYDCFNNGFRKDDVDQSGQITIYQPPHVPSLVSGPSLEYERVINEIFMKFSTSQYKDWLKAHSKGGTAVSDMLILANTPELLNGKDIVREFRYHDDSWKSAKAIHFCNGGTGGRKLECITAWLQM